MSAGDRGVLIEAYASRFGEPRHEKEAYGYWLFVVGAALGVVGLFALVASVAPEPRSSSAFAARRIAGLLGGLGFLALMLGVVYRLPVRRVVDRIALLGVGLGVVGLAGFLFYYPANWNVPAGSPSPDYAVPVAAVYGVGVLVIAVCALVLPFVVGTREEVGDEEPDRSKAKFDLYRDKRGEWRWNLRHNNGNIIADSGEGYSSKAKAKQGLESVRKNSVGAPVNEREQPPAEEELPEPVPQARYELYEDKGGEYRWRLVHDNGNILADSGEGYSSRSNAEKGLESVKKNAPAADHLDITPAGFEVYKDAGDEWRWRLIRRNGRIIADSGEGYTERNDAAEAVERVQTGDAETEVYEDESGEHRWRLVHDNGNILADSGEGYSSERAARDAAERFEGVAPDADVVEKGSAYFTVYKDAAGEWRWHLVASNGRIIADSGEGYTERNDAVEAVGRIRRHSPAPVVSDEI
jgi:uncharacterized protein YegP (UPF0339 family)